jgi:hypothetical protein
MLAISLVLSVIATIIILFLLCYSVFDLINEILDWRRERRNKS